MTNGRRPRARHSKLDAYKPTVDRLLSEEVWNAVVILRAIEAEGYVGEISILRDYIQPKRPLRARRMTVRFETGPGVQRQQDWGQIVSVIGGREQTVHFAVNTLGYSRHFHVWATDSEDAEHTYESIVRAFEFFGGVPREVLVDNQKSAVIAHWVGMAVQFNPRFVDLAGQYGFLPKACRPYRARTKGKTERMVEYVKQHFFVRYRAFESLSHLNQLLEQWLQEEAIRRIYGTYKAEVAVRFAEEQAQLMPLPAVRFDTAYRERRFVAWDGYVDVRGNRYSVPASLCGQAVTLRITLAGELVVYDGEDARIARHHLQPARAGWQTVPAHHAGLWRTTLQVARRDLSVYEEEGQWN